FAVMEAIAFVVYLAIGRGIWFWGDEWELLARRGVNAHDLLASHGGHLIALPLLVYRALFALVGLRSYVPYQMLSIGLWLLVAALLRAVMRRADVAPWIATAAAAAFLFFGSAGYDVLW